MDAAIAAKLIRGALEARGISASCTQHSAKKSGRKIMFVGCSVLLRIEIYDNRIEVWDLRPAEAILAVDKNIAAPDLIDSIVELIDDIWKERRK